MATASVTTDQADYSPGSVVTISGTNDETGAPGYTAGNDVDVSAAGGSGWTGTCSASVADDSSWACQVTLSSDPNVAAGSYNYTATSIDANGNPISETGSFTDNVDTDLSMSLGATSGTYGDTITATGQLTNTAGGTGIANQTIHLTGYSDNTCSAVSTASLASATTETGLSLGDYSIAWKPNAGTYYVEATFSGGPPGFIASHSSPCTTVVIDKAPTDTSITTTLPTTLALGNSLSVGYKVESAYGVSGNTTAGTVAITEETGPSSGLCPSGGSATLSQAQNDADGGTAGAGFTATGTVSCTPGLGTYTYRLVYSGETNYLGSDNGTDEDLTVNDVTVQVCKAAPAVAVDYMTGKVKPYTKKWNTVITDVASQTGSNGQFFAKNVCDPGYATAVTTYINQKYGI